MYNEVITLISCKNSVNEYGDEVSEIRKKNVFAKVKSVGMKEKYTALSVGLNPELVFLLADYYEYNNEKQVEYEGITYDVIRTYRTGIELEVVVSRGNTE